MVVRVYYGSMLHNIRKQDRVKIYAVARYSVGWVIGLLAVKYGIHLLKLDIVPLNSLVTSLISSATFIIGFLLSGLIADFKEAEKIPAELVTALKNMWSDGLLFARNEKKFLIRRYAERLLDFIVAFKRDVHFQNTSHTVYTSQKALDALSESFFEMQELGNPPNYVVKLKQDQAIIRRIINRVSYVQRIHYIPSANVLVRSMTYLLLAIFLFLTSEARITEYLVYGCLTYLFVYVDRLIHIVEEPFQEGAGNLDDVSLYLLEDMEEELRSYAPAPQMK